MKPNFSVVPFIHTNQTSIAFAFDCFLGFIDINKITCMDESRCGMQTLVSHCLNTWSTKRELGLFIFLCQTQKCLLVEVMTALSNCGISARHAFFYAFNSNNQKNDMKRNITM